MASACPGLLAAARDHVRIVNNPGSGLVEAPALAAFLPDLARRLLGEDLALPSAPTVWLGDGAACEAVLREPDRLAASSGVRRCCPGGRVGDSRDEPARPAGSGGRRAMALRGERGSDALGGALPGRRQAGAAPHAWSACFWSATAPAGGLCRAVSAACCRMDAQAWPSAGPVLAKDVWVLAENPAAIEGPPSSRTPPLAIRRTCRRHAEPGGRQFLLARSLPGTPGGRGAPVADRDRPRQPTGTDPPRDGGTGGADRLPDPGRAAECRGDRRTWRHGAWQGVAAGCRQLGRDPCHARSGLPRDRTVARPGDGRDARRHRARAARGGGRAREHRHKARGAGAGCDVPGDVARPDLLGDPLGTGSGEHGARRRQAVPRSRAAGGARPGGGRPDRLCAGISRRGAAAGTCGAWPAPGAGIVRFVDHLSQPLPGSSSAGTRHST